MKRKQLSCQQEIRIVDMVGSSEPRKIEVLGLPGDVTSIRTGSGTRMQPAEFGILRTMRLCQIRAKARKEGQNALPSKVKLERIPSLSVAKQT